MRALVSRCLCLTLLTLPAVMPPLAMADTDVLGLFIGEWTVAVEQRVPVERKASHREHYVRMLDGAFIRGEIGPKFDGSREISIGGYDAKAEGYAFWVFSTTGTMLYVPPGQWDEQRRTLTWENPAGWDVNYFSQCRFPDRDTRECTLTTKNWYGKVLFDSRWRARRVAD